MLSHIFLVPLSAKRLGITLIKTDKAMKRIFILLSLMILSYLSLAQTIDLPATEYTQDPKANFRLYKTENKYNFIKLDTRTGQMELVQWSLDGDRMSYRLSNEILTSSYEEQIPGRFTLYATTNMYQFVLLDQIDGRTWHVQWGTDKEYRWVKRIWFNEEIVYEPDGTKKEEPKIQPKIAESTMLNSLNLTPVEDEYKLQVTMLMASTQEKYRNQLLGKSPINVAYMNVVKKLMLSTYDEDWKYVESLTNFVAHLLDKDCTVNTEELANQLDGKTEYKEIIRIFKQYQ